MNPIRIIDVGPGYKSLIDVSQNYKAMANLGPAASFGVELIFTDTGSSEPISLGYWFGAQAEAQAYGEARASRGTRPATCRVFDSTNPVDSQWANGRLERQSRHIALEEGKQYLTENDGFATIAGQTPMYPDWVYSRQGDWYVRATGQFVSYSPKSGPVVGDASHRDIVRLAPADTDE